MIMVEIKAEYDRDDRRWRTLDRKRAILSIGVTTYLKDTAGLEIDEINQIVDRLRVAEAALQEIRSLTYGHGTTNL